MWGDFRYMYLLRGMPIGVGFGVGRVVALVQKRARQ